MYRTYYRKENDAYSKVKLPKLKTTSTRSNYRKLQKIYTYTILRIYLFKTTFRSNLKGKFPELSLPVELSLSHSCEKYKLSCLMGASLQFV